MAKRPTPIESLLLHDAVLEEIADDHLARLLGAMSNRYQSDLSPSAGFADVDVQPDLPAEQTNSPEQPSASEPDSDAARHEIPPAEPVASAELSIAEELAEELTQAEQQQTDDMPDGVNPSPTLAQEETAAHLAPDFLAEESAAPSDISSGSLMLAEQSADQADEAETSSSGLLEIVQTEEELLDPAEVTTSHENPLTMTGQTSSGLAEAIAESTQNGDVLELKLDLPSGISDVEVREFGEDFDEVVTPSALGVFPKIGSAKLGLSGTGMHPSISPEEGGEASDPTDGEPVMTDEEKLYDQMADTAPSWAQSRFEMAISVESADEFEDAPDAPIAAPTDMLAEAGLEDDAEQEQGVHDAGDVLSVQAPPPPSIPAHVELYSISRPAPQGLEETSDIASRIAELIGKVSVETTGVTPTAANKKPKPTATKPPQPASGPANPAPAEPTVDLDDEDIDLADGGGNSFADTVVHEDRPELVLPRNKRRPTSKADPLTIHRARAAKSKHSSGTWDSINPPKFRTNPKKKPPAGGKDSKQSAKTKLEDAAHQFLVEDEDAAAPTPMPTGRPEQATVKSAATPKTPPAKANAKPPAKSPETVTPAQRQSAAGTRQNSLADQIIRQGGQEFDESALAAIGSGELVYDDLNPRKKKKTGLLWIILILVAGLATSAAAAYWLFFRG